MDCRSNPGKFVERSRYHSVLKPFHRVLKSLTWVKCQYVYIFFGGIDVYNQRLLQRQARRTTGHWTSRLDSHVLRLCRHPSPTKPLHTGGRCRKRPCKPHPITILHFKRLKHYSSFFCFSNIYRLYAPLVPIYSSLSYKLTSYYLDELYIDYFNEL